MAREHSIIFTPKVLALFWAKVDKAYGDCWIWTGSRDNYGYGLLTIQRRLYTASRVSYFIANGPIPNGMLVCHHCDNPPCVNPSHLFIGSHKRNIQDSLVKGRCAAIKLTENQVREIRRRHRENRETDTSLA